MPQLDIRETESNDQHREVVKTFQSMEPETTLTLITDHNPEPLFFEIYAECGEFDSDGYELRVEGEDRFVAKFPKE